MPTLLDVRNLLRSRRQTKTSDVLELARRLARNETIDPDDVLASTAAAGVDDDAFADLVDMIRRRDELRRLAAQRPALERDLEAAREAIRRQRAALDEAEARYRRAVEPLIAAEAAAEERARQAGVAANELLARANLPTALVERLEDARETLHAADANFREAKASHDRQQRRAVEARAALDDEGGFEKAAKRYDSPDDRGLLSARAAKLVEDVRHGSHRAAELAEQLAALTVERNAAQAAFDAAETACREF
jgi:DNA repair exonuclease SbcCD ATPase subunit